MENYQRKDQGDLSSSLHLPVADVLDRIGLCDVLDLPSTELHELADMQVIVCNSAGEHFPGCHRAVL
jgi:hypothetical protein